MYARFGGGRGAALERDRLIRLEDVGSPARTLHLARNLVEGAKWQVARGYLSKDREVGGRTMKRKTPGLAAQ